MYSIGDIAKRADVSVQTLRHYHQKGLLEPSHVSESGYRRYSEHDYTKLSLIRTLRDVGFDLSTIAQLLEKQSDARAILQLQIEVLDEQRRALERQRIILNAVAQTNSDDDAILAKLQRLNVLAKLSKLEREAFLAKLLGQQPTDAPSKVVWEAAVLHLPEEMTPEQLEIWLELADIASDKTFQQTLQRQQSVFEGMSQERMLEWQKNNQDIFQRVIQNLNNLSEDPQDLLDDWIKSFAKVFSRKPDEDFKQWMLEYFLSTQDPRIERYWQLMSQLKNLPFRPQYGRAFTWLLDNLKRRIVNAK